MRLASSRLPLKLLLLPSAKHAFDAALKPIEQATAWAIDHAFTQAKLPVKLKDVTAQLPPLPSTTAWDSPDVTLVFDELAYTNRCSHVLTGYWDCSSLQPTAQGTPVGQLSWQALLYSAGDRKYVGQVALPLRLFHPQHTLLETLQPASPAFEQWLTQVAQFLLLQVACDVETTPHLPSMALYADYPTCVLLAESETMSRDVQLRRLNERLAEQGQQASALLWSHCAKLQKSQRQFASAAHAYQQALQAASPQVPHTLLTEWLVEQGACHALANDPEAAMAAWHKAISVDKTLLSPYLNLAMTLEEMGHLSQAIAVATPAVTAAPPDARLYHLLARLHSQSNQWDEALAYYQLQLIAEPDNPWTLSNLAVAYLQKDHSAQAIHYLKRTVALDPDGEAGDYAQLILGSLTSDPLEAFSV
jgi:tetratricopeptide (TPR) repeat protein